jgi:hypothetical protein
MKTPRLPAHRAGWPRAFGQLRVSSALHPFTAEGPMSEKQQQEQFDTGLGKIKQEIKSRLVAHGLYGSFAHIDAHAEHVSEGVGTEMIEIIVKGRRAVRSFDRAQIEHCCLRVGGAVLLGVIAMIEEVAAQSPRA